jgi:hypothetical protein
MSRNDHMISLRTPTPSTRVAGHGLWSEGWPVDATPGKGAGWRPGRHRTDAGCGLCECGEMSPVLDSVAARRRWHKEHKQQIREKG